MKPDQLAAKLPALETVLNLENRTSTIAGRQAMTRFAWRSGWVLGMAALTLTVTSDSGLGDSKRHKAAA